MRRLWPALALLVAACSTRSVAGAPAVIPAELKTSVRVQAEFQPGGYASQGLMPWTVADVHHFVLALTRVEPATESIVTDAMGDRVGIKLEKGALSAVRTLAPLRTDSTYRIRPYAYSKAEESDVTLISRSGRDDYLEFKPAPGDKDLLKVVIRLSPVPFDGQMGWEGVEVAEGGYVASDSLRLGIVR